MIKKWYTYNKERLQIIILVFLVSAIIFGVFRWVHNQEISNTKVEMVIANNDCGFNELNEAEKIYINIPETNYSKQFNLFLEVYNSNDIPLISINDIYILESILCYEDESDGLISRYTKKGSHYSYESAFDYGDFNQFEYIKVEINEHVYKYRFEIIDDLSNRKNISN